MLWETLRLCAAVCLVVQGIAGADVLWERPFEDPAGRFALGYRYSYTATEKDIGSILESIRTGKADKGIIRVEVFNDASMDNKPCIKITFIQKDLVQEAEQNKWTAYALEKYVVKDRVGPYEYDYYNALHRDLGYVFSDPPNLARLIMAIYKGPKREYVAANITETRGEAVSSHEFLRRTVREECWLAKYGGSYVIENKDTWGKTSAGGAARGAGWIAGPDVCIDVTGLGVFPKELILKYLEKLPSTLTKDFRIDKTQWGRDEMDLWLRRMGKAIETGDKGEGQQQFAFHLTTMWNYIYVPFLGPNTMWESPFEDKKRVYDQLVEWWASNKETSYWHKKYQCLMVKGQSPEEVQAAAKKKEEADIKAKLDTELTEEDLKRITLALVRKFEAREQYLADLGNKALGADSGNKFEKVADGQWHSYYRQSNPGPLYRKTITGPTVRECRDRKFPLVAEFRCVTRNMDTGKETESKRVYHYRKLEDCWSEGPPPK